MRLFSKIGFVLSVLFNGIGTSTSRDYLYQDASAKPVIEYVAPKELITESDEDYERRKHHPDFLFSEKNGQRIVIFYAPWCPHCIHFKPKYIELAKKVIKEAPEVKFYAISCTVFGPLCREYEIQGYPTLKYFSSGNSTGVTIKKAHYSHKSLLKEYVKYTKNRITPIKQQIRNKPSNRYVNSHGNHVKNMIKPIKQQTVKMNIRNNVVTKEALYHDASLSFNYALSSNIFMTNDALSVAEAAVFEKWIRILSETLPETMTEAKSTVRNVLDHISLVVQSEQNLLNQMVDKDKQTFWTVACSHGVSNGGYTCGLWELFHIVTIGLVVRNNSFDQAISTMHVADGLRDYILHFFACDICRKNFIDMYDSCSFDRCNVLNYDETKAAEVGWKQLPLWLWEVHNDVNMRLFREESVLKELPEPTIEEQQAVRWPSRSDCRGCWEEDTSWNEDEVYLFLYRHYWPGNTLQDQSLIIESKNKSIHSKESVRTNHNMGQLSVMVLMSFGLLLYLYARKRQKRQIGIHKKG